MKKSFKILLTVLLVFVLTVGAVCVGAVASEEETPVLQITDCTLSFDDSVYIMYALPVSTAAGADVDILYFTEAEESVDEYNLANAKYRESHIGTQTVPGRGSCYIYKNRHMNAKNMTDVVYARAYASVDGVEYYSNLVKYSILEYSYNTLGRIPAENPTASQLKLKELLETMLAYGAASQKYFNYNTENLATDEYFKITVSGGHLEDMSAKGMFKAGETVTLRADETDKTHTVWLDSEGNYLDFGSTYTVNVTGAASFTAEGHNLVFIEAKAATCTENGNTEGIYCSTCNKVFVESTEIISAGHSFADGECTVCGEPYNPSPWDPVEPSNPEGTTGDVNWYLDLSTGVLSITGNGAMENSYSPWSDYADNITAVEVGEGVTDIGAYAFKDLTLLTSVSLPESLNIIRYGAFQACTALEVVDIPENVNSISGAVFNGCTSLVNVNIPEGVAAIGNNTFYQCASLEEIVIPNSVTSIANSAFNACSALKTVVLSKNVTEIGNYAFFKCGSLETLYFAGDAETFANITLGIYNTPLTDADAYYYSETQPTDNDYSYWHYADGEIVVWPEYVAPTSEGLEYTLNSDGESYTVSDIGTCTDTELIIPETYNGKPVTSIGESAFYWCDGLTSVVIPDSVTSIGERAFRDCSGLTSVVIGNSVESIGSGAFSLCFKLVEVVNHSSLNITAGSQDYGYVAYNAKEVHTSESKIVNYNDYLFYTYDGINYLIGYIGEDTALTLPESYNGENYEIYKFAFYEREDITIVKISDCVTCIGKYAFSGCSYLTSITVDENNANYKSIDGNLYSKDEKILIQYAIGKTDTSFNIPESVKHIGERSFYHCDNLMSVVIPYSVAWIDATAFWFCDSLTSVVIGDGVTRIFGDAFHMCNSLTSVYYKGTAAEWSNISIGSSNYNLTGANRYYYSESQPTDSDYNYWHYVGGEIVVWEEYVEVITEPTIVIDSLEANAGDEVTVNISLKNNPGVASLILDVVYESEGLTLTGVTYNGAMGGQTISPEEFDSPVRLYWINFFDNTEGDQVFATLTFSVKENASVGEYNISLSYNPDNVYNIDEENLDFDVINGSVIIKRRK